MQFDEHVKAFFLALAAAGKDAWNTWRSDSANKDVYVTFSGIDFSQAPKDGINFSGFEFGDCADFSQCKWRGVDLFRAGATDIFKPGRACFLGASFGYRANFEGATFNDFASFTGASFGDRASFAGAAFGQYASFTGGVEFGAQASFEGAMFDAAARLDAAGFDDGVSFRGATFDGGASFQEAVIGPVANFDGTAFGDWTFFDFAVFKGAVTFNGKPLAQWTEFFRSITHGLAPDTRRALKKMHKRSWKINGSAPDRFLSLSFPNVHFCGDATFSGRSFERRAVFTASQFDRPPDFDAVTNASRIDFTGAHFSFDSRGRLPWDSEVLGCLRTFRKVAEETKNHDLEHDLYIEERKAERGVSLHRLLEEFKRAPITGKPLIIGQLLRQCLWIAIIFGYWALADYGRSVERPLAWLVVSVFIFHYWYALMLTPLKQQVDPANKDYYDQAVWMLALGDAVPFVGHLSIDAGIKKSLYCPSDVCGEHSPIPPLGVQVLVIVQNVVSITLIFFFGLALRNYFKIK
ncbi:MAG TPA: pentapeptide repeat-containing protein [Methylocella sp.]